MSKKKRHPREQSEKSGDQASSATASARPSMLPVVVALSGLAALAFVLLTTESPRRESPPPVPTLTDLERWQSAPEVRLALNPEDIVALGPEDAPVTIVEFSDFECPYCEDANGVLKSLDSRYRGQIRLVFKNYPLDTSCNEYVERSGHLYACKAAVMAHCAGAQDRFWEMHDAIFALDALSVSGLDALPAKLSLDEEAFAACVADEGTMRALRADMDEGNRLGVTGTPAIFVNGKQAASFRSATLVAIIDHILAE